MMRKAGFFLSTLLVIVSTLLVACGPTAVPTAQPPVATAVPPTAKPADTPVPPPPTAVPPTAVPPTSPPTTDRVVIRWFVGLGTGADPEQIPLEEALVEQFNASQDQIELKIEFYDYEQSVDQLKTQIAAGNVPDIIGPVGQSGTNPFTGLFLDLTSYLDAVDYDFTDIEQSLIDFYTEADGSMYGLPFALYPAMLYYNRDLFDEAGLDYPPHTYGEAYADGDPWTVDKMEELAMVLTVDGNGNDANSPDFDPDNIVQFGYTTQWNDPRGEFAALFGNGSLVDDNGEPQLPDNWRAAIEWYFEAMHVKHFMPNQTYENSDLLAAGNMFDSGNVAMAHCALWYTCCNTSVPNWDMAAVPAYNDSWVVLLDADSFRVMKDTQHPEEAVAVLRWLTDEGAADLLQIYGGLPARSGLRDDFFASLDETFPQGVDWQVALDGLAYPDKPNHEGNLPNYVEAYDRLGAFVSLYHSEPTLDLDAEIDTLLEDLKVIYQ